MQINLILALVAVLGPLARLSQRHRRFVSGSLACRDGTLRRSGQKHGKRQ